MIHVEANMHLGDYTAASCDDKECNIVCYQHGGATGGKCDSEGQCKCDLVDALPSTQVSAERQSKSTTLVSKIL